MSRTLVGLHTIRLIATLAWLVAIGSPPVRVSGQVDFSRPEIVRTVRVFPHSGAAPRVRSMYSISKDFPARAIENEGDEEDLNTAIQPAVAPFILARSPGHLPPARDLITPGPLRTIYPLRC